MALRDGSSSSLLDWLSDNQSPVKFSAFIADVLNDNKLFTEQNKFSQEDAEITVENNISEFEKDGENLFKLDGNVCYDFEFRTNEIDKSVIQKSNKNVSNIGPLDCGEDKSLGKNNRNFGKYSSLEFSSSFSEKNDNSGSSVTEFQNSEFDTDLLNALIRNINIFTIHNSNQDVNIETEFKTENSDKNKVVNSINDNKLNISIVDDELVNNFFVHDKNSNFVNYFDNEFDKELLETVYRVIEENGAADLSIGSEEFEFLTELLFKTDSEVTEYTTIENGLSDGQILDWLTEILSTGNKERLIKNLIIESVNDEESFEYFLELMNNLSHNEIRGADVDKVDDNIEYFTELMEVLSVNETDDNVNDEDSRILEYFSKIVEAVNNDQNDSRSSEYLSQMIESDDADDIFFEKFDNDSIEVLLELLKNMCTSEDEINVIDGDHQNFEGAKEKSVIEKNSELVVENPADSGSFENVVELLKSFTINDQNSFIVHENDVKNKEKEIEVMETTINCENGENIKDPRDEENQNLGNRKEVIGRSSNGEILNQNLIQVSSENQSMNGKVEVIRISEENDLFRNLEVGNKQNNLFEETQQMKSTKNRNLGVENKTWNLEDSSKAMETLENSDFFDNAKNGDEIECLNEKYLANLLETASGVLDKMSFDLNENENDGDYVLTKKLLETYNKTLNSDDLILENLEDVFKDSTDDSQNFEFDACLLDPVTVDQNGFLVGDRLEQTLKRNGLEDATNNLEKLLDGIVDIVTQDSESIEYLPINCVGIVEKHTADTPERSENLIDSLEFSNEINKGIFCGNDNDIQDLEPLTHASTIDIERLTFLANVACTQHSESTIVLESVPLDVDKYMFHVDHSVIHNLESTGQMEALTKDIENYTIQLNYSGAPNLESPRKLETGPIDVDNNTFNSELTVNEACAQKSDLKSPPKTNSILEINSKASYEENNIQILNSEPTKVSIDFDKNTFEDNNEAPILESTSHLDTVIEINENTPQVNNSCAQNLQSTRNLETNIIEFDAPQASNNCTQNSKSASYLEAVTLEFDKNTFQVDCTEVRNPELTSHLDNTVPKEIENNMEFGDDYTGIHNLKATSDLGTATMDVDRNVFEENVFVGNEASTNNIEQINHFQSTSVAEINSKTKFEVNYNTIQQLPGYLETFSRKFVSSSQLKIPDNLNSEVKYNSETETIEFDRNTVEVNCTDTQSLRSIHNLEVGDSRESGNFEIFNIGMNNNNPFEINDCIGKHTSEYLRELMEKVKRDLGEDKLVSNDDKKYNLQTIATKLNRNKFTADERNCQNVESETGPSKAHNTGMEDNLSIMGIRSYQNMEYNREGLFESHNNDKHSQHLEMVNGKNSLKSFITSESTVISEETIVENNVCDHNIGYETIPLEDHCTRMDDDKCFVEDKSRKKLVYTALVSLEDSTTEMDHNTISVNDNFSSLKLEKESINTVNNYSTVPNGNRQNSGSGKGYSVVITADEVNQNVITVDENSHNLDIEEGFMETVTNVSENATANGNEQNSGYVKRFVTADEVNQNIIIVDKNTKDLNLFKGVLQTVTNVNGNASVSILNDQTLEFVEGSVGAIEDEMNKNITVVHKNLNDEENTSVFNINYQNSEFEKGSLETTTTVNKNPFVATQNLEFGKNLLDNVSFVLDKNSFIVSSNENQELVGFERVSLKNVEQDVDGNKFVVDGINNPLKNMKEITYKMNDMKNKEQNINTPDTLIVDRTKSVHHNMNEEKIDVSKDSCHKFKSDKSSSKSATRFGNEEFVVVNIVTGPEDGEESQMETSSSDLNVKKVIFNGDSSQNFGIGSNILKEIKRNKKYTNDQKHSECQSKVSNLTSSNENVAVDKWFQDENAKKSAKGNVDRLLHPKSSPKENLNKPKAPNRQNAALNSIQPLNNLAAKEKLPLKNLNSCENLLTKAQIMRPIDIVPDRLVGMECVVQDDLKFAPSSEEMKQIPKKKDNEHIKENSIVVDTPIKDGSSVLVDVPPTAKTIPGSFCCSLCPKEFREHKLLLLHESTHSNLKKYSTFYNCTTCNKNFTTDTDYKQHMVSHKDQRPKTCKVCSKTFKFNCDLARHLLTHNRQKPFVCAICKEGFTHNKSLQLHALTHINTDIKPFECPTCGKRFSMRWNLEAHKLIHRDYRPFVCAICNLSFKLKTDLIYHQQAVHMKEQAYPSSRGDRVFSHRQPLSKNIKNQHCSARPFTCDVCDKQFPSRTEFTAHYAGHTGNLPHVCTVCGKLFRFQSSLKSHSLLHSNERPFSCSICSKRFAQKTVLEKHRIVHTRVKKY